ncbi:energy transducer TonB [Agaribacter marinus]|uniref:Protein TonB n=1 Tax=Agaribacter marinus TaxID=1431249 RepID=A0AA37T1N2_9ALTE|nr:energy transducer TonB [Agaribacter marinus]GLR72044.1 protein TonB [Agaribacter marinus]
MTNSLTLPYAHVSTLQKILSTSVQTVLALGVTFSLFVAMQKLTENTGVNTPPPPPPLFVNSRYEAPPEKTIIKQTLVPLPKLTQPPKAPVAHIEKVKPTIGTPNWTMKKPRINTNTKPTLGLGATDLRPLVRANPTYPVNAARDGIEGFVVMSFNITATGNVEDIKIVNAEPKGIFERAARRALLKWKYQPQMNAGKPTPVSGLQVKLEFNLSN